MRHKSIDYLTPGQDALLSASLTICKSLKRVKQTGFWTIVPAIEVVLVEFSAIADVAEGRRRVDNSRRRLLSQM
jgi:hypothetical protein